MPESVEALQAEVERLYDELRARDDLVHNYGLALREIAAEGGPQGRTALAALGNAV